MEPAPEASTTSGERKTSLGRRMASGALWLVGLRLALRGIGLASTLILARLLVPEDFGLVALATTFAAFLETASDFNFDLAIIRQHDSTADDYDTAWTLNLIKALVIAVALYLTAGWLATFFADPRLEPLFELTALAAVIQGLWSVRTIDFRKDLELHKEFLFRVWAKVASFVIVVVLALLLRSYWALMINIVLGRIVLLVLSYTLAPYRPRLSFKAWRRLVDFSKWLAVNNLLSFARDRMDTLIIGKLAGAGPLGLYNIAHEIADLPTSELAIPVNRAVYPAFAKLRSDREALRHGYLDSFALLVLITSPIGIGIGLLAEPMVQIFLGAAWIEVVPLIQGLVIYGLLRTFTANANAVYLALGRLRIEPALTLLFIAMALPGLLLAVGSWGAIGATYVLTLCALVNLTINLVMVARLLELPWRAVLVATWRTLAATATMVLAVEGLAAPWPEPVLQLLWSVPLGATAFCATLLGLWRLCGLPDGPERHLLAYLRDHIQWFGANQGASSRAA